MIVAGGGREALLVVEFVWVDEARVAGVAEVVVVDGLVNLDCLAQAEHDGCLGILDLLIIIAQLIEGNKYI